MSYKLLYELPEPEDGAVVQLLSGTVPQTNISAKEEDFSEIARRNDRTFSNVVENLVKLRNRGLPLTPKNYRDTLTKTWKGRYQDAVQKYPIAKHIYEAVDLLRRFDLPLERFTVEPTALLMVQGNFWQQLWCRWKIRRALAYLIEAERILTPRDGQIEAQGRQVEAGEYSQRLTRLVLQLADKHPQEMLASLPGFGGELIKLNRYKEALDAFDEAVRLEPGSHDVWNNRGIALVKLDRYEEAVASYNEAVKKPDYHSAWDNRGNALVRLGRYEEAVASY